MRAALLLVVGCAGIHAAPDGFEAHAVCTQDVTDEFHPVTRCFTVGASDFGHRVRQASAQLADAYAQAHTGRFDEVAQTPTLDAQIVAGVETQRLTDASFVAWVYLTTTMLVPIIEDSGCPKNTECDPLSFDTGRKERKQVRTLQRLWYGNVKTLATE